MSQLFALGNALEASARADLLRATHARIRRRIAIAVVSLAILVPSVAFAAVHFLSNEDVAQSLPAGALILAGTEPTCTTVKQDVEYHCVLTHAPVGAANAGLIKGTVYETVDATYHVNGGCRALNAAGTEWECYIGQAAVDQQIIGQDFLGQVQTTPAVG
jgi:hypothetical protein